MGARQKGGAKEKGTKLPGKKATPTAPKAPITSAAALKIVNGSMSSMDQPCCVTHKGPSCISSAISACVCKFRPQCCQKSWDVVCVDSVMSLGCASCSAASLEATPLVTGVVQTGGRRSGSQAQINLV